MGETKRIRELFEKSLPLFNALGDPVRQQIVLRLMDGEAKTVNELTIGTDVSRPTISFHLKILREAGILADEKRGRNVYYHAQPGEYIHIIKQLVTEVDKQLEEAKHELGKRTA